TTKKISASINAVPRSGSITIRPASQHVTIPHGTNVRIKSPSSPARFSRKYARKITSANFDSSEGCTENHGSLIQRCAPLLLVNAKTESKVTVDKNSRPKTTRRDLS